MIKIDELEKLNDKVQDLRITVDKILQFKNLRAINFYFDGYASRECSISTPVGEAVKESILNYLDKVVVGLADELRSKNIDPKQILDKLK